VVRWFALQYIAGEELEDAVRVVRTINSKRMMGSLDVRNLFRRKMVGREVVYLFLVLF
jgi:hypothetical protein